MRWRYLLFDLDGTLTDPMLGITRSVQYALRRFGIEIDDLRTLCRFIGPPLKESFRDFYGMDDEQAARAVALTREYFAPRGIFENRLYEGIPELLTELQAAGCMLAMATSKPEPFARQIAEHFHLTDDDRAETIPSGFARYANNAQWACTYLKQARLIESPKRGFFHITQRGKEYLGRGKTAISRNDLLEFPESFL